MIRSLDETTDIVYSEDEGKWYLQNYCKRKDRISPLYSSEMEVLEAYKSNKITWRKL